MLGSPVQERHGHAGVSSAKDQEDDEGTGSSVQPGEYKAQRDLIHVGKYGKRVSEGGGARLFLVLSDHKRGNEHKLKYRNFCLNTPPFFLP